MLQKSSNHTSNLTEVFHLIFPHIKGGKRAKWGMHQMVSDTNRERTISNPDKRFALLSCCFYYLWMFLLKRHDLISPFKRLILWLQIEKMKVVPRGVTDSVQFILYAACSTGPLKLQCLKYLNSSHLLLLLFTTTGFHQMYSWCLEAFACFMRFRLFEITVSGIEKNTQYLIFGVNMKEG